MHENNLSEYKKIWPPNQKKMQHVLHLKTIHLLNSKHISEMDGAIQSFWVDLGSHSDCPLGLR